MNGKKRNAGGPRIIVALDYADARDAEAFVARVQPARCRLKVGKELFTRAGPDFVRHLVRDGFDVFLDLKFHDIPNTVAGACRAAAELGVWMMNVHTLGGQRMMEAARKAVDESGHDAVLIGVTILTSMQDADLAQVGLQGSAAANVQRLAALAEASGLDGVVCSPQEVAELRKARADAFCLVTPGIRPAGSQQDDQRRVMTPADAVRSGSDYLVIGRPVTAAADPMGVLLTIESEIDALN